MAYRGNYIYRGGWLYRLLELGQSRYLEFYCRLENWKEGKNTINKFAPDTSLIIISIFISLTF